MCILLMTTAVACNNQPATDETEQVAVAAPAEDAEITGSEWNGVQEAHADIDWEKIEVFDFSRSVVDKHLPLYGPRQQFEALWGKADSLVTPDYEEVCGAQFDDEFSYYYRHGSRFELCRDSIVCDKYVFSPTAVISSGKISLSAATTWEQARKLFPMAARQADNEGSTEMLMLRESPDGDAGLQLQFRNGKLYSISYNLPC